MADGYRGIFGAFPYAFRSSDSWIFRSYVVVSSLVALLIALLFIFALIVLIGRTASVEGGTFTLSRAFYVVIALFLVSPVIAPTLLVARRHRRGIERRRGYDARIALAGYLFILALYVGTVIAVPPASQTTPTGPLAAVGAFLYSLPRAFGVVPPVLAAVLIVLVHRRR
ncbi:MAG: hypothetical protein ABEJ28_06910 [Salinigranum sp.]